MKLFKAPLSMLLITALVFVLSGCTGDSAGTTTTSTTTEPSTTSIEDTAQQLLKNYQQDNDSLTFDDTNWSYDKDNDVYWQIGVQYSSKPATTDYETLAVYVPGAYMTATDNGDGTYTASINDQGKVGDYTAATAPIVFPVNTAGYSAQKAATAYSYDGLSSYMKAGYIYVYSGMRGRDNGYDDNNKLTFSGGAPWGVTDLKAAVRYYKFNKDLLPGNTEHIFTFGHSGGGAQSALMGATGDSQLYYNYLTSIGSAMFDTDGNYISDAIYGAMAWCPITSLDYADAAYEWNMGQYASTGTRAQDTFTAALSKNLAEAYAGYLNELGLKDEQGTVLTLAKSDDGIYTSGTYYTYLQSVVETSLNHFLTDTTFPYTQTSGGMMGDGGFAGGGSGGAPSGEMPSGKAPSGGEMPSGGAPEGSSSGSGQSSEAESTTYETAQAYIDSLNEDSQWVTYDASSNTAKITSVGAFVEHLKNASKDVPAFDDLNRKQAENNLFGNDDNDSLHFDAVVANLLEQNQSTYAKYSDWNADYVDAYKDDLQQTDALGNTIEYRLNMYNPMYYLLQYYKGYQTSNVAPHWRIRTGIDQGDTASTVEVNLALALKNYTGVKDVDFETIWNQGHTTAERTGSSTDNFISWVNETVKE